MASLKRGLAALADAVLFSYSEVLFARDRAAGLLILAATFAAPRAAAFGLAAVLLSIPVVRLLGFSTVLSGRGIYGYNPLLVGLAVGTFVDPLPAALAVLPLMVVAVVLVQTALESWLGYSFNLPVLSMPFVLTTWVLLATLPLIRGAGLAETAAEPSLGSLPQFLDEWLRALGAVFFVPEVLPGALVAAALLRHSRIALLLSLLGFSVAYLSIHHVLAIESHATRLAVSCNALLTAIAVGGVWFVPQRDSFLFAALASLLTVLLAVAGVFFLLPLRMPVLILPFNLAMFLVLYAMRQRVRDRAPKSVDFAAGTPEANLHYYRTRLARFGNLPRLSLPFSGRWVVTQGVDGAHTHQGLWRHALDFEVRDASGSTHAGSGRVPKDYYCWRLPVRAPADGTVVKVVSHVPDNPIGERNLTEPWGNLVVMQHGPALYSLCCHLANGSVEVSEGQFVRRGSRVGLCGNSGRSFVPHLHFQIQSTPRVGAPTRELEVHDVVVCGEDRLFRHRVPGEGEEVRNIEPEGDLLPGLGIGTERRFRVTWKGRTREERLTVRIDLYNYLYLESDAGDRLYFEKEERGFVAYDYQGRPRTALFLLYASAPRVPFERPGALVWDDVLSLRPFRSRLARWAHDLLDPFLGSSGLAMTYRSRQVTGGVEVTGEGALGRLLVRTRAFLDSARGPTSLRLEVGDEAVIAEEIRDA